MQPKINNTRINQLKQMGAQEQKNGVIMLKRNNNTHYFNLNTPEENWQACLNYFLNEGKYESMNDKIKFFGGIHIGPGDYNNGVYQPNSEAFYALTSVYSSGPSGQGKEPADAINMLWLAKTEEYV